MQRPLVRTDLAQAVQRQIDTFADTDSGGASEQQRERRQVAGARQFLLQELIVLWGKRSGEVVGERRKVLAADEMGSQRMAVGGQILEQAAEINQKKDARPVGQRRLLLGQGAEPAEQMGIAAELAEAAHPWKSSAEIGQEAPGGGAIALDGAGAQCGSEIFDVGMEDLFEGDLFEGGSGSGHQFWEESKGVRFSMARRYSRQTSWGASWT